MKFLKVVWEESDIIPGRRIKSRPGGQPVGMICYHIDSALEGFNIENSEVRYSIVSLAGGTIGLRKTMQGITHWLTDNGYLPFD